MLSMLLHRLYNQAVRVCHLQLPQIHGGFRHHFGVNSLIKMKNPAKMAGFWMVWSEQAGSSGIRLRG